MIGQDTPQALEPPQLQPPPFFGVSQPANSLLGRSQDGLAAYQFTHPGRGVASTGPLRVIPLLRIFTYMFRTEYNKMLTSNKGHTNFLPLQALGLDREQCHSSPTPPSP